eukprot:26789-Pyramimonas_sp.AAC.1
MRAPPFLLRGSAVGSSSSSSSTAAIGRGPAVERMRSASSASRVWSLRPFWVTRSGGGEGIFPAFLRPGGL